MILPFFPIQLLGLPFLTRKVYISSIVVFLSHRLTKMLKTARFVITLALVVCLPALIGLGWWQRDYLMGWYLTDQLLKAEPQYKSHYIDALAKLGENAQYPLLDHLEKATDASAPDLTKALGKMFDAWGGAPSPLSQQCFHHLARRFTSFSAPAQTQTIELLASISENSPPPNPLTNDFLEGTKLILGSLPEANNPAALVPAMKIVSQLIKTNTDKELHSRLAGIMAKAITDAPVNIKIQAIHLAIAPEVGLTELSIAALQDKNVEVRKVAILACASAIESVSVDSLLPSLHDSDSEIRAYCESALIARGLNKEHLQLGKLLTDPRASKRLEVLDSLMDDTELDQSLWLRKLSHDSSPAVRVAALRMMSLQEIPDLHDRIDQMSRSDPSKTVSDLAAFYLKSNKLKPVNYETLGNSGNK
ncbi:hypothetical protein EBS67_10810 [bacterium]|nr:hypothetical protein [bacterium]